jgi:hypothetical protein
MKAFLRREYIAIGEKRGKEMKKEVRADAKEMERAIDSM